MDRQYNGINVHLPLRLRRVVHRFPTPTAHEPFGASPARSKEFRLAVFTLNYDDVDRAPQTWFDGFTGANGEAWSFDARAFDGWRDAEQPVLVHLHGSIRFGYARERPGLAKYSGAESAFNTIKWTRTGDDYSKQAENVRSGNYRNAT
jgi:hypothetical protein